MDNKNEVPMQPAGIFQPLGGVIIDLTLITTTLFILFQIFYLVGVETTFALYIVYFIFIAIPLYFTYFLSKYGQTPGYKFLNIKMVSKDGKPISAWKAFTKVLSVTDTNTDPNYGYGSATDNAFDITTIKTGESKWKTIFTCGCLGPILFIAIVAAANLIESQLSVRRSTGAYKNLSK